MVCTNTNETLMINVTPSFCFVNLYVSVTDDLDTFLTMAEKQKIILNELEAIRAVETDSFIPGLRDISLYQGEAISKSVFLK